MMAARRVRLEDLGQRIMYGHAVQQYRAHNVNHGHYAPCVVDVNVIRDATTADLVRVVVHERMTRGGGVRWRELDARRARRLATMAAGSDVTLERVTLSINADGWSHIYSVAVSR